MFDCLRFRMLRWTPGSGTRVPEALMCSHYSPLLLLPVNDLMYRSSRDLWDTEKNRNFEGWIVSPTAMVPVCQSTVISSLNFDPDTLRLSTPTSPYSSLTWAVSGRGSSLGLGLGVWNEGREGKPRSTRGLDPIGTTGVATDSKVWGSRIVLSVGSRVTVLEGFLVVRLLTTT